MRFRLFLLSAALLALSSCSNSPTEPEADYIIGIEGMSSNYATFSTADGQPWILGLDALLDGENISGGVYRFVEPVSSVRFSGVKFFARRGHHLLSLKVTSSSPLPVVCVVPDVKILLQTSDGLHFVTVTSVVPPARSAPLRSGESIDIAFDI